MSTLLSGMFFHRWRSLCKEFSILMYRHKGLLFSYSVFEMLNNIPTANKEGALLIRPSLLLSICQLPFWEWLCLTGNGNWFLFIYIFHWFVSLLRQRNAIFFPPVNIEITTSAGSSLKCPEQLFSVQLLFFSQLYENRNYSKSWAEESWDILVSSLSLNSSTVLILRKKTRFFD